MSSAGQISAFPSEGRHNHRSPAPGPHCRCLAVIYPLIGRVRSHGDAHTDSPDRSPLVPQDWPKVCRYARTLPNPPWGPPHCHGAWLPSGLGLSDRQLQRSRGVVRGPAGADARMRGSRCRVGRNPESRPPILGSSRAGVTLPPEPPGPLRHCCRHSLYVAPSAVVDRRLKIGNRGGPEPEWGHRSSRRVLRVSDGGRRYPTRTAAASTVVQSPFLSPTAVWVTFCVRTIWFESR